MASRTSQTTSWLCALFLTAGLALGGCLSDGGGQTGGETHWNKGWLSGCARDAECDEGLECLGNLCTIPCSADAECVRLDEDAACLDIGELLACMRPGEVEVEPTCGDGALDVGEDCDDGNRVGLDGCSADCGVEPAVAEPVCGDGELAPAERCDDGNNVDGDGCSAGCASLEVCGDGYLNAYQRLGAEGAALPPEVCDDGNNIDGDGCSASCGSLEVCGDGVLDPGEECDDGNTIGGDGCSIMCALEQ